MFSAIKDELHRVSEEGEIVKKVKDPRRPLLRYPKTSNGIIGWIAAIDEFQLQILGPDVSTDPILPDNYFW